MTPEGFRAEFPALTGLAWLDTPGAPPAARGVDAALRGALDDWLAGEFDWEAWDGAAARGREVFADWLGVPRDRVASLGSLAEAAATVARSRRAGTAVLAADEFQSLLLPFLAEAERDPARPVALATQRDGQSRSSALLERIVPGVTLVAVSTTTTLDGELIDLAALRERTREVGAELFVNGTQSLGVLRLEVAALRPDYVAAHGYKWLLAPRGAAWLYAAGGAWPDSCATAATATATAPELIAPASIAPSWHTAEGGNGLFGGVPARGSGLAASGTSPAWFSWVGAVAALELIAGLDAAAIEGRALELAERFTEEAVALGATRYGAGRGSHIRVVRVGSPEATARELERAGVRARIVEDRVRVGVHGFNTHEDIDRAITALRSSR